MAERYGHAALAVALLGRAQASDRECGSGATGATQAATIEISSMRSPSIWISLLLLTGCGHDGTPAKRTIVLGIDAMDPGFLERHWMELPNLRRLRDTGGFQRLATTVPPQSPVAWSTFATGLNPGGHGVFDFIHRNPATLTLFSSMAETEPSRWTFPIGPYRIPLSSGHVRRFRRGVTFWELLDAQGIPATLLRMPNNFPPVESESHSLSGMGTPDMLGTFGTFTFFTSESGQSKRAVPGGRIVPVTLDGDRAELVLEGPENTLRKDRRRTQIAVTVWRDTEQPAAVFEAQGRRFLLCEGEWSEWIRVSVPLLPPFQNAHTMFRLYAKQLRPALKIYVSPLNIDPFSPDLPISTPPSYSAGLAAAVGPYYTQGIAEDTSALREGVLTLDEYGQQAGLVAREQFALLHHVLRRAARGVVFFHFLGIDQDSHILWGRHEAALLETYKKTDLEIGRVARAYPDDTLIVMSDHGFSEFRRAVHLNRWLMLEGFLTLDLPFNTGDEEGLVHVDWAATQAYSIGLNGIYVNLAGRERNGIVKPSERDALVDRIVQRLKALRDPETGGTVVAEAYRARDVYRGEASATAPDIVVGWNTGYRSSWQTALGAVPSVVFEDNKDEWRGDHCIAAHLVPGVFLSNRKTRRRELRLEDITVTLLNEYGVKPGAGMTGRPVF
ncbi:MAG: alkaline phosphatase family protein [Bryobacterales bacterium]|nr:alkaline phosphatase family protein [Bryobacterales bacterium]